MQVGEQVYLTKRRWSLIVAFLATLALAWGFLLSRFGFALGALLLGLPFALAAGVAISLLQPSTLLIAFLLAIPVMGPMWTFAGMNPGELATLAVLGLGALSFLSAPRLTPGHLGPVIGGLFALSAVAFASTLLNSALSFTELVASAMKPFAFAAFTLLLAIHARDGRAEAVLKAITLGGVLVAGYAIFSYVAGWSYYETLGYARTSGSFEHWNQLGGYMLLVSFPTLGYALIADRLIFRLGWLSAFAAQLAALFLSFTLGSLLGLLVAAGAGIAGLLRFKKGMALSLAAAVALPLLFFSATSPVFTNRVSQTPSRATDRLAGLYAGTRLALDHFWWGVGSLQKVEEVLSSDPAGYRYTPFMETSAIPHNTFLLLWAQNGIIAMALLVFVVVRSLQFLGGQPRSPSAALMRRMILLGILGFLVQNATNDLLLHARIGLVFFALIFVASELSGDGSGFERGKVKA